MQSPVGFAATSRGLPRRAFLKHAGLAAGVLAFRPWQPVAGPFEPAEFAYSLVPADKKLSAAWLRSLVERGEPSVFSGPDLDTIGMPVGGICAGQLYLGGDGRLWHWDIFNAPDSGLLFLSSGPHYATPLKRSAPLEQGFALKIRGESGVQVRRLDSRGFREVSFSGQYPIGTVTYRDANSPVEAVLEAYSPFIPLNAEDSGLPATVIEIAVKNCSSNPVEVELCGWLENAVCKFSPGAVGSRRNRVVRDPEMIRVEASAIGTEQAQKSERPEIVFADFEGGTYGDWTAEGTAFGSRPAALSEIPAYQSPKTMGVRGQALANSHSSAPGSDSGQRDQARGKLTSPMFTIERHFIRFLIGGGANPSKLCLRLVIDGEVVRSATGHNNNKLRAEFWNVADLEGKQARLEILDDVEGGWGNIGVDDIVFSDSGGTPISAADAPDSGTLTLALLDPQAGDQACADVGQPSPPEEVFRKLGRATLSAQEVIPGTLAGAASRSFSLAPGRQGKAVFVIAWHFPRLEYTIPRLNEAWSAITDLKKLRRYYASRFEDSSAVAVYLGKNFARLSGQTRLWRDTWYDSTLPFWLLDRTLLNISTLATSTCHRFDNGRYWFWEGVYCCQGTCTHVWHYAQAIARIFPEIERDLRERVDYGLSFNAETGMIGMRSEHNPGPATDGHAGTILRTLREHQMSRDAAFLQRNWAKIRKAVEWLVGQDENGDGIITVAQPNTLDREWYGEISWISSLYVAALTAAAELASEMGDLAAAERWSRIALRGSTHIRDHLFHKGQYFIQQPDPAHLDKLGSGYGCEIDQVFGQSWAWQVGLGRILPEEQTRAALNSLWRYNFAPDVGLFRKGTAIQGGRWFAMPGEGGLIMCTFPDPDYPRPIAGGQFADYFNECMTGFEYQVASHMVWEEGALVEKGLAVARMIHDRYHPSKRNPWNEVECGDHYGRALASYGVFTGVCGFEYHGPKGHIGFSPRLTPEDFRCAFTSAAGWGTFWQKRRPPIAEFGIRLRWGELRLKTIALAVPEGAPVSEVKLSLGEESIPALLEISGKRVLVVAAREFRIPAGTDLHIELS